MPKARLLSAGSLIIGNDTVNAGEVFDCTGLPKSNKAQKKRWGRVMFELLDPVEEETEEEVTPKPKRVTRKTVRKAIKRTRKVTAKKTSSKKSKKKK